MTGVAGAESSLHHLLGAFASIASEPSEAAVLARVLDVVAMIAPADGVAAAVLQDDLIVWADSRGLSADERDALLSNDVIALLRVASMDEDGDLTMCGWAAGEGPGEAVGRPVLGALVESGTTMLLVLAGSTLRRSLSEQETAILGAVARQASAAVTTLTLLREREAEAAAKTERRIGALVRHSSDVTTLVDDSGTILFVSPSVERILGYAADDLVGSNALELVHPDDRPGVEAVLRNAMRGSSAAAVECKLRRSDGRWLVAETNLNSLLHDPEVRGVVLNTRDISERKALENELAHQALHDSLTDLANRGLFQDRIDHSLARSARHDTPLAVLLIDLDDFKKINDSKGHAAGDALLVQVAQRLKANLRGPDTAARVAGDEFALLVEDMRVPDDVTVVANRILESMKKPFDIEGREITVSCSIGIAVANPREETADELLRNADVAMHSAKQAGKATFAIFEPSMRESLLERIGLETDLRRAVTAGEFVVYYQPTVSLADDAIAGLEALVRWEHPTRGLVSPAEFIPLAEETGLIVDIGRMVLEQATKQVADWQKTHASANLSVNVNLSGKQLEHSALLDEVKAALKDSGLNPGSLVLEITETVLLDNTAIVSATLNELKRLGVRLAIDDFGTGYSSLAYLQKLPVDVLKIDRSFVSGLNAGSQEWAVTRAIIELGQSLDLQTVAEGIEMKDQLDHLKKLQCDLCQGFFFARPADAAATAMLLERAGRGEPWAAANGSSAPVVSGPAARASAETPPVVAAG